MKRIRHCLVMMPSVLVLISGFGSCQMSLQQICSDQLPEFLERVQVASQALLPQENLSSTSKRELASSEESPSLKKMTAEDQAQWTQWAEEKLLEVQRYADVVEEEPALDKARYELTAVANELVVFHGYAQLGDGKRMASSLKIIHEQGGRAKESVCAPLKTP